MKCEKCGESLGAGDISAIPDGDGEITFKVICHDCDTVQSSKVVEEGGMFFVMKEGETRE